MTKEPCPHYDVVIIGAGSVGAPAAYEFAKAGYRTLVLESHASVGQESNKKAIGGIRATHSDPAKIRLCLRSIEIFSEWQQTYGEDIEWTRGGYCFVAYRDQEENTLKALTATQKRFGLKVDYLGKDDLLEVAPDLNPNGLLGGSFSPDDGSASPLLATHAFYRQAKQHGAAFHFNEPVREIIVKSGKVSAVRTDQGVYGASMVINAAGAWANQISQMVGVEVPVKPDSHEAAITEAVAHFLNPMIVDIRSAPGSANYYFYQHATGQILFCITPNPSVWGYDTNETSQFLPMVAKRMVEVMPRLKNLRVRRTWRGLYPMTPDGFPIVGWADGVEGFLNAVGMCGQGFMLGPGLAELLVRMAQDELTPDDRQALEYMAPEREFGRQELLK